MPNCFSLVRKSDVSAGPVSLHKVDEELCAAFGQTAHPIYYGMDDWYGAIGFGLAMGKTFDQMITVKGFDADWQFTSKQMQALQWLNENFTSDAWYEVKR